MWKFIVPVFLLGCSLTLTTSYIIKGDKDVLLYFSSVNVTVRKSGVEKVESVTFNSNNTAIDYDIGSSDTDATVVQLMFRNNPSKVVEVLNVNLTITRGVHYWKVSQVSAVVKGEVDGEKYNGQSGAARFISSFPIEAPLNKSFHCGSFGDMYPAFGQSATFGNFTPVIQIFGLQIQAFNGNTESFVEAWECVGFFTAGIWSGLFVAALLIGIMTWGLAMIMDVKTMDRFDDPKGKAISFGGTE
ncbi:unnamed protein product [Allacma fusca]|uniref:V-type proton ATPase subunit S1/VOA1 transmembrane domain-containing protein n=1 Tax=Allacma fusca TaxID=39272 RepID=A0A8J2LSK4_9HEXA|nr:unnamed protein product [Allacma fusca]